MQVTRWRRYGKDRLYVRDDQGADVGWWDLATNEGHPAAPDLEVALGTAVAYIVPIVDHVLRRPKVPGVKAIIVYPMNALANSQRGELKKFLVNGYGEGREPVTFARYTGQERGEERDRILANPPDILLTNYVMLELVLTRPEERRKLVKAAKGLQFLVLDELHTYRGRQGADVAMLVRRVRRRALRPTCGASGRRRRWHPAARRPTSSAPSPTSPRGSSGPTSAPSM